MKGLAALCLLGAAVCGAGATAPDRADDADAAQPATVAPAVRQAPVCTLAADDPSRLAVEPCRPAPPGPGRPRRGVAQIIERMPPSPPPVPAPMPGVLPARPAPVAPAVPSAPLPATGCDVGGCRDAAGARHNGGVGNVTLDPGGRPCVRNGVWLQCF